MTKRLTTIIVGGGCIGLCTALALTRPSSSRQPRKVIVIEASDKTFAAASGNSVGVLHHVFPESDGYLLREIGKYSYDLWQQYLTDDEVRAQVGYRDHNSFELLPHADGHNLDAAPDWLEYDPAWSADPDFLKVESGTVHTGWLGTYLTTECRRQGVEIFTETRLVSVELDTEGQVQSVGVSTQGGPSRTIASSSMVLAAGPWTPQLFKQVFPAATYQLDGLAIGGDWLTVKNLYRIKETSKAWVGLQNIVGHKFELNSRADGTILIIGTIDEHARIPEAGKGAMPDPAKIEALRLKASKFLRPRDATHSVLEYGCAVRPGRESGVVPVISEVPACVLSGIEPENKARASGVFLNWGHGSYGHTLGMGSGVLMSQLINDETPDIDTCLFAAK